MIFLSSFPRPLLINIIKVGKPIRVPPLEKGQTEPTHEQLVALQNEYIKGLEEIYHKYKDVYAKDRKQDLRIID